MLDNRLIPVEPAVEDAAPSDVVRRMALRFDALMASLFAEAVELLTDVRAAHP